MLVRAIARKASQIPFSKEIGFSNSNVRPSVRRSVAWRPEPGIQIKAALDKPAALIVLLAAAARAGRIRLGLLPPGRPGQCLAWVVADDLVDSSHGLGCLGIALCRRQREEPPGLLVVLGDASSSRVT